MARIGISALLLVAVSAAGCAGTAPGSGDEPTVELVVHNERANSVTAFLQWEGRAPARLGEVAAGRSGTYLPRFGSGILCVTSSRFSSTTLGIAVPDRRPGDCTPYVRVSPGERLDVVFHGDGRICYLQHDPPC
jgi:hypothetical protein